MDLSTSNGYLSLLFSIAILSTFIGLSIPATSFTFENNCDYKVWPGTLAGAGSPNLGSTGFQLAGRSFEAPPGWSGRLWARTGGQFDVSGKGSCSTADCGSGAVPPAT